jgi:hypothetical protein
MVRLALHAAGVLAAELDRAENHIGAHERFRSAGRPCLQIRQTIFFSRGMTTFFRGPATFFRRLENSNYFQRNDYFFFRS